MMLPRQTPGPPPIEQPAAAAPPPPTPAAAASAAAVEVQPPPRLLDNSSPEAFIRSVAPYAARVSHATGIPVGALIGMAANETGYGRYAEGNNLFGIKGKGTAGSINVQTWEDYGSGAVTIRDDFRAYYSPAESFVDFAKLVTTSPRYKDAVGQTTVEGFVDALRRGGYMTDPDYVHKISAIATRYSGVIDESVRASGMTDVALSSAPLGVAAQTAPAEFHGVKVPNQFAIGLPTEEAYSACGPVAAMAFAQVYGRNPSAAEAMDLAKQSGWSAGGGMNGITNEKRLLDKMGLPSQLEVPLNWDHVKADALLKRPVILSTPGHYFVIDGFDERTGAYHVGQSGLAYRNGAEWMTPAQINAVAGAPSGALYAVNPTAGGNAAQPQTWAPIVPTPAAAPRPVMPPPPPAPPPPPTFKPVAPPAPPPPPTFRPVTAPTPPPAVVIAPPPPPVPVVSAPPPVAAPAAPPPPVRVESAPPPAVEPPPPPPVKIVSTPPPAPVAHVVAPPPPPPQPVVEAAMDVDSPTINVPLDAIPDVSPPPSPSVSPAPPPAHQKLDLTSPPVAGSGLAVGAVAAGAAGRQVPPPPPPRRRPEDDEPLPPSAPPVEDRPPRG